MPGGGIDAAFAAYVDALTAARRDDAWDAYADCFTPDAVYRRHGHPDAVGREAIAGFAHESMTTFPGSQIGRFDVTWHVVDHEAQHVVFEVRHVMRDPGDGSHHEASTASLLTYAGGGRWNGCADLYSPHAYAEMVRGWLRASERHSPLLAAGS